MIFLLETLIKLGFVILIIADFVYFVNGKGVIYLVFGVQFALYLGFPYLRKRFKRL